MRYIDSSKVTGVDFQPWAERVKELLEENELPVPDKHKMSIWYNKNFTYYEVLLKVQLQSLKYAFMTIHAVHGQGVFEKTFQNDAQAREFFKKFPEIRDTLKT